MTTYTVFIRYTVDGHRHTAEIVRRAPTPGAARKAARAVFRELHPGQEINEVDARWGARATHEQRAVALL